MGVIQGKMPLKERRYREIILFPQVWRMRGFAGIIDETTCLC